MVEKIWCQCEHEGREAPWEDHTYHLMCMCPLIKSLCGTVNGGWNRYGITVDRELAYPAVPHPRCVVAGTCQGSCLGGTLTLVIMASFMVLVMPWDSLSTMERLSSVVA